MTRCQIRRRYVLAALGAALLPAVAVARAPRQAVDATSRLALSPAAGEGQPIRIRPAEMGGR